MKNRGVLYLLGLIAAYFYCTLLSLSNFADDPGVGWHLATGMRIFQEHAVPHTDTFLSVVRPWISDQWFSDLVLYVLYRLGGWPLLYASLTVVFLGVFFFIAYLFGRAALIASTPLLLAAMCMAKLATVHFILRPVLFSFVFFSIVYGIFFLASRRKDFALPLERRWLLVLGTVFLLWTNMHPSFVMGVGLSALFIASVIVEKFLFKTEFASAITVKLLLAAAGLAALTLVNPYGLELHKSILWLSQSKLFMSLHEEWKPLNIDSGEGGQFCFVLFAVVAGLYVFGKDRIKASSFELLAFIAFAYLAMHSVRFLPYFGIVGMPLLASIFSVCMPSSKDGEKQCEQTVFLSCTAVLIISTMIFGAVPFFSGSFGPSRDVYPYQAVDMLHAMYPDRESIIVDNHPNFGGFLIWQSNGWIKPVIDDRNTLVGEEGYQAFLDSLAAKADIKDFSHDAQAVLLRTKDLDKQYDPLEGFTVLAQQDGWLLARPE